MEANPSTTELAPYFEALLETGNDLIAVFDTDLNYMAVNQLTCEKLHKRKEELVGKNLLDVFPQATASFTHRNLLRAIGGEAIKNAISDNSYGSHYISNFAPVFNNGVISGAVVISKELSYNDINGLSSGTRISALQQSVDELRDFVENAALPLHWVNGSGVIIWANKFEMDMLGYTKEEYIGSHVSNFHADKDVIEDILKRLISKETLIDYPARLKAKDGSVKSVLINSNVYWKNGKFIHTRCFTREVSDYPNI